MEQGKVFKHKYIGTVINGYTDRYTVWYRVNDIFTVLNIEMKTGMDTMIEKYNIGHNEITSMCECSPTEKKQPKNKYRYITHITEKNAKWYIYVPYRIVCRIMNFHKIENKLFKNWIMMTTDILNMNVRHISIYCSLDNLKYKNYNMFNICRAIQYFIHTEDFRNYVALGRLKKVLISGIWDMSKYLPLKEYNENTTYLPGLMSGAETSIPYICQCDSYHIHKSSSVE